MANIIVKGGTCDEYVSSVFSDEKFKGRAITVTDTALCDDGLLILDNYNKENSICTLIPMDILEEIFRRIIHKYTLPHDEEEK